MVLPTAHGTHPDGDPFEAADKLAAQGSLLSRMEARAIEQQQEEGIPRATPATGKGRGQATTGSGAGRSKRNTPSLYGSSKLPLASAATAVATNGSARKVEPEVMIIDDDEEEGGSPGKTSGNKTVSPVHPAGKPVSGSGGKPRSRRKSSLKLAVVEPEVVLDAIMGDATITPSRGETVAMEVSNVIEVTAEKEATAPIPASSPLAVERSGSPLIPDSTPVSPTPLTASSPVREETPATPEAAPTRAVSEGTPFGSPPIANAVASAVATTSILPLTTDTVEMIAAPVVQPKQSRPRSPSPIPAAKKVKRAPKTIRLEIDLKSYLPAPDDESTVPEYSVADLAREAGYLDISEGEEGSSSSESDSEEGESGSENEGKAGDKQKEKKEKETETEEGEAEKEDAMEGVENGGVTGEASTSAVPVVIAVCDFTSNFLFGYRALTVFVQQPPKRRRAPAAILGRLGGYDVADPFVDDTELSLFEVNIVIPSIAGHTESSCCMLAFDLLL